MAKDAGLGGTSRESRVKREGRRQEAVVVWGLAPSPHSILGAGVQQQLKLQLQPGGRNPCRLIFGLGNEKNVLCPRWQLSKEHSVESGQDERWWRSSETSWSLVRLPGMSGHPFCLFAGLLVGFPVFSPGKLICLLNTLQGNCHYLL